MRWTAITEKRVCFLTTGMMLLASLFLSWCIAFSQGLIEARHPVISLPKTGLTWLPDEVFDGNCEDVPAKKWIRKSLGSFDLLVHAEGPLGSGRYWILTVAVAGKHETIPQRGICLQTNTLGWRTLQRFKNPPLSWADDLDMDGKAELIVWDSFPATEEESAAAFGLMAWVYRFNPDGRFTLDWNLTRKMAWELAEAYRQPLQSGVSQLQEIRNIIARALEKFASGSKGISP